VLQSRLIALAAALVAVATGCGGSDGAIADNVVEPGITAIDQAQVLTCDTNLQALRTAIEAYTMLEGGSPANQGSLVDAGYLRGPLAGWDVVEGQILATDPQCGEVGVVATNTAVPATAPATTIGQIVTGTEPPLSVDDFVALFTPEEIAAMGGQACVDELAMIAVAGQQHSLATGAEPESVQALVDGGYLSSTPTLWTVTDDELVALDGSGCVLPDSYSAESPDDPCVTEARTLQVAVEAYRAMHTDAEAKPNVDTLVAEGLLRDAPQGVYIVDGVIVPVIGGPCEAIDLGV
jgi:hypothetical protein